MMFGLLLGTVPLVLLGILSTLKANGIIEQKVNEGTMQTLTQTQLKVEQIIQMIDNSITQFSNTTVINQSFHRDLGVMDYLAIEQMKEGLYRLQTYDLGISDVYLVNQQHGWLISNNGFSSVNKEPLVQQLLEQNDPSLLTQWITEFHGDQTERIYLMKKLPINTLKNPTGLIIAEIPVARLQKLLPPAKGEAVSLILDAYNTPLASVGTLAYPPDWFTGYVSHQASVYPDTNTLRLDMDGVKTSITYRKSAYNGWTYVSLVSIEEMTKDAKSISWYTLSLSTVMLLIVFLLAIFGSRRMYIPIRNIMDSVFVGTATPKLTPASDEFKLITDHIHSLHSTHSELRARIVGQTGQLRAFFVRKLLLGEIKQREVTERLDQLGYSFREGFFCVLTVRIDSLGESRYEEQDKDLLMFAINNIVNDLLGDSHQLPPVVMREHQTTILHNPHHLGEISDVEATNTIYHWGEIIQSTVAKILHLNVSIGISRTYQGLEHSGEAYLESLEALHYRIRLGESSVLYLDDVLPNHKIRASYPEWLEKQLFDAIKASDTDNSRLLLKELLQLLLKDNQRHQDFQLVLYRLLIDIIREFIQDRESDSPIVLGERHLFDEISHLRTVVEMEDWFMFALVHPIINHMSSALDSRNTNISDRMLEIIHSEFEQELSLEVCASRLNYHPNYLKTVFRKETGVSFSEYVSRYRLNKAKEWLCNTEMKVGEIAERLRYQNSQNFIRYFRKMEDITPGEYRKKIRMGEYQS